ncbi:ubiquitin carboxyl-terminal hydrolase 5-like [Amphibalanus amphitrite]|uniref:ubiquitin carboxyl-terminal hydrolase 5-like n=1 Tax=Amphibalanus amphitrite TaxID=1232801 RepID=UPI001C928EC3|nr:ubiquitin carboxyl-terminal hydrolase 5-like [Amphibalanus amphitrite]XP_043243920.1 ubiquitin carboxyl-terminal hydrolase 5-like [Amphibalanus amphitrite]
MEALTAHLSEIRCPTATDKVYKDQCIYSFDTPESPEGLYVCLRSFLGVGRQRVEEFSQRTGSRVFLHMRRERKVQPVDPTAAEEPEKKVTRLAIGVEGGFSGEERPAEYEEHNTLVVLPGWQTIPLSSEELPAQARNAVAAVIAADSAGRREELAQATGTWDGEVRMVSKHAETLQQLDNGVKVPPRGWQCAQCDKTDNLWLNLTDGAILCGRKFFDGSGGNNHAVEYYKLTGYPLAVKLGTISADGKADVFSYDEDDMVLDPLLGKHLAHFGINIQAMEKTDKSMVELEIEMNKKIGEWATIQEEGQDLKPLFGPGYTGLKNLGNSCYLNSAMQVMFTVPDFVKRYYQGAETTFYSLEPARVPDDFDAQMCKLAQGLLSGKYSRQPEDPAEAAKGQPGIEPFTFKNVVGRGHPEFSGKRQQDAQEFILHLINMVSRSSRHRDDPTDAFKFRVEERIECTGSHKVKYSDRTEYFLSLQIPMEAATNKEAVHEYEARKAAAAPGDDIGPVVRARVPFEALLEAFREPRRVEQFYSTALDAKTVALQTSRLGTFPEFLLVQLQRFTVGDDWLPKKLDVSIPVPDELDLSSLRGSGLQPGEQELPEPAGDRAAAAAAPQLDAAVISQLTEMGFPEEACKRAVYTTQNSGVEAAMAWIMEHMTDADFAAPFTVPGTAPAGDSTFTADPDSVALIVSMGFTPAQAERALKETNNSVERAADWIFSHPAELNDEPTPAAAADGYRDGPGKYQLVAFISHMGTSTMVGHYVCHVLKDGRWCIFNDEKVAESRQPPRELAYLYLYRRCQ